MCVHGLFLNKSTSKRLYNLFHMHHSILPLMHVFYIFSIKVQHTVIFID